MQRGRFRFEKLVVWQKAIEFAGVVYDASRFFPIDERFGLSLQMRKAAVSVSSNVAEGSSRSSGQDQKRFTEIAYGSLMETVSQSFVAEHQSYLAEKAFSDIYGRADEIARMLSGLKAKQSPPRS